MREGLLPVTASNSHGLLAKEEAASTNWMAVFLVGALAFYLPNETHFPEFLRSSALNLTNLLIGMLLLVWASTNRDKIKTPLHGPLAIFLSVSFFSLFIGLSNTGDTMADITMFWRYFISFLLFYFAYGTIRTEKEITYIYFVLIATASLIGIELSREGVLVGEHFADHKRASGPFGEGWAGCDVAGAFMAQMTPFLIAAMLFGPTLTWRALGLAGTLVGTIGILATYSRGSLVALGCAGLFLAYLKGKKYFLFGLILALVALSFTSGSIESRIEMTDADDPSIMGRFGFWEAGWQIFRENPLGVGFNHVWIAMKGTLTSGKAVDPHNGYIFALVEAGVIGLAALLFLIWGFYRLIRRTYVANKDKEGIPRVVVIGGAGMLVSMLSVNMFYSNFFRVAVRPSLFIGFALVACVFRLSNQSQK